MGKKETVFCWESVVSSILNSFCQWLLKMYIIWSGVNSLLNVIITSVVIVYENLVMRWLNVVTPILWYDVARNFQKKIETNQHLNWLDP